IPQFEIQPSPYTDYVSFSPGPIVPIKTGSAGIAILSARKDLEEPSPTVLQARQNGYAVSHGAIIPNITGVSAPVSVPFGFPETAVGVSLVAGADIPSVAKHVKAAARTLESLFLPQRR